MLDVFGDAIVENPFHNYLTYENHLRDLVLNKHTGVFMQQCIGTKPGGTKHVVDIVSVDSKILVSAKLQNVVGTAEEKIPYEQLMLQEACDKYGYNKAFIVCAGSGWRLLNYYTSPEYRKLINTPKVELLKYEDFAVIIDEIAK